MRGIIPNAFEDIFAHIQQSQSSDNFLVHASYLEIHNEEVRDLLAGPNSWVRLELRESPEAGVYVKNLTSVTVQSVADISRLLMVFFPQLCLCVVNFCMLKYRLFAGKPFQFFFCQSSYQHPISHDNTNAPVWFLQVGKKSRSVAATLMNQDSSRSHSIFTITVETSARESTLPDGSMHIRVGKLNLVQHPCLRMFHSWCLEGTKVKWQLVVCWFVYVFTMILWNMSDALVVFLQIFLEKIWCFGARLQCSRETLQPSHEDF